MNEADEADNVRTGAELLFAKVREFVKVNAAALDGRLDLKAQLLSCCDDLEGIVKDLKPHVIGVTGDVSVGKTSFINSILSCGDREAKLLTSSVGETSGAAVEISSCTAKNFNATIYFLSKEDISEMLQYCARFYGRTDDNRYNAHMKLLNFLFAFDGHHNIGGALPADERYYNGLEPVSFIGRAPLVLSADSIAELRLRVRPYMETFSDLRPYAVSQFVKRIVCKGPFTDLPLGIVLVDTPGLRSSTHNMAKTMDELSQFDELWYVDSIMKALAGAPDRDFVRNFYNLYNKPVHLIGTFADCVHDENLIDTQQVLAENFAMTGVPNAEASIVITGNPVRGERIGYATILTLLRTMYDQRQRMAEEKIVLLASIEARIRQFGIWNPTHFPPNLFDQWLVDFRADISASAAAFTALQQSAIAGNGRFPDAITSLNEIRWADPNKRYRQFHWAVREALMSRSGVYSSPKYYRTVNLNEDIVQEWITRSNVEAQAYRTAVNVRMQQLPTNDLTAAAHDVVNSLSGDFRQLCHSIKETCFGWRTVLKVQDHFERRGIYNGRNGRIILPEEDELLIEFASLAKRASKTISNSSHLLDIFQQRITNLHQPVDSLSRNMRISLDAMLDEHDENGISYDAAKFTDYCFSYDIFVDPVQICPMFQHVFERQGITQWLATDGHGCPCCRFEPARPVQFVDRPDIVAAIRWWRARLQTEAVNLAEEWWMEPWQAGVEQRVVVDEEDLHQAGVVQPFFEEPRQV